MSTIEIARKLLDYDPLTGSFRWKDRTPDMFKDGKHSAAHTCAKWNAQFAGREAGSPTSDGYWRIFIGGKHYRRGRLVWAWETGSFPKNEIDHCDLNRMNDVIENLRDAESFQNKGNQRIHQHNSSGAKGVSWDRDNSKWEANIHIFGKKKRLGRFASFDKAKKSYEEAAKRHFGEFARVS